MSQFIRRVVALPALALSVGIVAGAASAPAQGAMCTAHQKMTEALGSKFGEKRKIMGLVANSGLMEIYVSTNGTWTVILTNPEKVTCIVAAGHSWEDLPVSKELSGLLH